jgi:streptomycin 6-kinase
MTTGISAELAQTIQSVHGDGAAWLARFPTLLEEWQARWRLVLEPPFPNLSYNYVAPGTMLQETGDRLPVVLKAGPPSDEVRSEIAALQLYAGRGAVRLLDADAEQGALLLARLLPGRPLVEDANDVAATAIAAQVMRKLWQPLPANHAFPTVQRWAAGLEKLRSRFDGTTGPLPPALVHKAERLFTELLASMDPPVVLHGDLHHDNILYAGQEGWLAIDPKGVGGEPAYEPGAWLRNPMTRLHRWSNPPAVLARRVDQFAEILELDRSRIAAWGLAQAVLSAWWSVEDHGCGWEAAIRVAEWLDPLVV